jgi:hypothetical protein
MTDTGLERFLPASVQKSYFMLSDAERDVLNTALEKYRAGRSEPILVGGEKVLKPVLRLMTSYRWGFGGCLTWLGVYLTRWSATTSCFF